MSAISIDRGNLIAKWYNKWIYNMYVHTKNNKLQNGKKNSAILIKYIKR